MSRKMNVFFASMCLAFSLATHPGMAQPSSEVCNSNGGPELCVRFDNMANPPQEGTDFTLTYASGIPSVLLVRGDDAGTIFEWRIWSRVSPTDATPAAIGSITGSAADDYKVTVLNASGTAGASDVDDIDIDPSDGANFSNLAGLDIGGDLGGLVLQKNSSGLGGDVTADLIIGGSVTGAVTIPGALLADMTVGGDVDAAITIYDFGDGDVDITFGNDVNAHVRINDRLDADVGDPPNGIKDYLENHGLGPTVASPSPGTLPA